MTPVGQQAFFACDSFRPQLWRTDGTPGGTLQLTTLEATVTGIAPWGAGVVFTIGRDQTAELWRSDGTVAGTEKLLEITEAQSWARALTAIGSKLFFIAPGGPNGREQLFRSDGTPGGTVMLTAFASYDLEGPAHFVSVGSTLYFTAFTYLWATDGTVAGTHEVHTPEGSNLPVRGYAAFGNSLVVLGEVYQGPSGLWLVGNAGPANLLKPMALEQPEGYELVPLPSFAVAGGKLFFTGFDADFGAELWVCDGTAAGTRLAGDVALGRVSSHPRALIAFGSLVFFTADDRIHGPELWRSDGTVAGTRLVQDLHPGALGSEPRELSVADNTLFFAADDGVIGSELWRVRTDAPSTCVPSATALCLNGGRFRVEARWRDSQGHDGVGTAVPLTGDTGYFWFFDPKNVELMVKELDGRGVNGHFWTFYGALSNVQYAVTVTDVSNGSARRYFNPLGDLASLADTTSFGPLGASRPAEAQRAVATAFALVDDRMEPAAAVPCVANANRLCLNDGRFGLEVAWKDPQGHAGKGTAVSLTGDTGYFWFFDASNIELVSKVIDGRAVNGKYWVFYGALSNVEYTLTVTDSVTGQQRTYRNPQGRLASVADTAAF